MDLISREAVDNAIYDYCHSCDVNESQIENYLCELPSAFEGMTNGEVIQALFPKSVTSIEEDDWVITNIDGCSEFTLEWWNAPYKGVSE